MTFTQATSDIKPDLIKLFKSSFGDDDSYINLFFDKRFKPNETMVALFDNKVVSMLFALPIDIVSGSQIFSARYIYAVATDPKFRSRGFSSRLMEYTHEFLKNDGVDMSLLVPASKSLFEYYEKLGYHTKFYVDTQEYTFTESKNIALIPVSMVKMASIRENYFKESSLFARWDNDALAYQDAEAAYFGGETLYFKNPCEGYALCYPFKNAVIVKEIVSFSDDFAILNSIATRYNKSTVIVRRRGKSTPFGMICQYSNKREEHPGAFPPYLSLVLD